MSWALSTQPSIFSLEAWEAELVLYRKCSCMFMLTPLRELAEENCKCYYTMPCVAPLFHWEPLIQRKKGGGKQGWDIPVFLVNTILAQNPTFNNRALPLPCKIIFGIIFGDQWNYAESCRTKFKAFYLLYSEEHGAGLVCPMGISSIPSKVSDWPLRVSGEWMDASTWIPVSVFQE